MKIKLPKSAADDIQRLERSRAWKDHVTPRNILIALLVIASYASCYVKGKRDGQRESVTDDRTAWTDLLNRANILRDQQQAAEARNVDAVQSSNAARKEHAKAAARFTIAGNEIAIDGGPPASVVPAAPVIQELKTAQAMRAADSTALAVSEVLIATKDEEIAVQTERVSIAERTAHPRFGIKTGVALGATGVVVLVALTAKVLGVLR